MSREDPTALVDADLVWVLLKVWAGSLVRDAEPAPSDPDADTLLRRIREAVRDYLLRQATAHERRSIQRLSGPVTQLRASFRSAPAPTEEEQSQAILHCFAAEGIALTPPEVREFLPRHTGLPEEIGEDGVAPARTTAAILGRILLGCSERQVSEELKKPKVRDLSIERPFGHRVETAHMLSFVLGNVLHLPLSIEELRPLIDRTKEIDAAFGVGPAETLLVPRTELWRAMLHFGRYGTPRPRAMYALGGKDSEAPWLVLEAVHEESMDRPDALPSTIAAWKDLPLLPVGRPRHLVLNMGYLHAPLRMCRSEHVEGLPRKDEPDTDETLMSVCLGFARIKVAQQEKLFRIPLPLSDATFVCVSQLQRHLHLGDVALPREFRFTTTIDPVGT